MILVWITHPYRMASVDAVLSWMQSTYPLYFAQNVITTGLLAFKIWVQHRASVANGVADVSSKPRLIQVLRIVIESAAIYTCQLLLLVIFCPMKHSARFIVESAIIPSIGETNVDSVDCN